jgi:hypothetical protein
MTEVLGRMCGTNPEEVTGGWRKLHIEELHNSQCSPNKMNGKLNFVEMSGACSTYRRDEKCAQKCDRKA